VLGAVGFSLCLGFAWIGPAAAQILRDHDVKNLRSFHGAGAGGIKRSFQSDAEAQAVFRKILIAAGLAGLEDRIVFRASAETSNAEAFIEKNKDGKEERLIFYNAAFMQELRRETNYWSMIAVLAHEIGHHVRWHTEVTGRNHEFELEADYQAGFILRRMGATLEQAQAAFRTFPIEATPTHPGRAQRLQIVTLGWTDGGARHPPPEKMGAPDPSPPPLPPPPARFFYVWDTRPPDDWLALRSQPSEETGRQIMRMKNGTLIDVLEKRQDNWWRVRVVGTDEDGWVLSRQGDRVWIYCCRAQ
jgi:hypothetical protein